MVALTNKTKPTVTEQLGKEKVYFLLQRIAHHLGTSGQELKAGTAVVLTDSLLNAAQPAFL